MAVLVLYFITGIGSGAANIPAMGLVSAWFGRTMRGRAAGFVVIGSGFAIILAGWFVPWVSYIGIAHLCFLPLPEAIWDSPTEQEIVRRLFIFLGFLPVVFCSLCAALLIVPRNRFTGIVSAILAGLALGAAVQMIWLSPGGWCFIMR